MRDAEGESGRPRRKGKRGPKRRRSASQRSQAAGGPKKPPACLQLFGGVFVVVGVVILVWGINQWRVAKASEGWPTTQGLIVHSEVVESSSSDGTTYQANVRYEFDVDGVGYPGDTVAFADPIKSEAHATTVVKEYPRGKKVTVHYWADDPKTSVLEPGVGGSSWLLLVIGPFFSLIGFLLGWVAPGMLIRSSQQRQGE